MFRRFNRNPPSFIRLHHQSENLAFEADQLSLEDNMEEAERLYNQASILEEKALNIVPFDKIRTRGILIINMVTLAYKAGNLSRLKSLAEYWLQEDIPSFVKDSLEDILDEIEIKAYRRNPDGLDDQGNSWGPSLYNPLNDKDHPFKDESHYQKIIAKLRRNPFNPNYGNPRRKNG